MYILFWTKDLAYIIYQSDLVSYVAMKFYVVFDFSFVVNLISLYYMFNFCWINAAYDLKTQGVSHNYLEINIKFPVNFMFVHLIACVVSKKSYNASSLKTFSYFMYFRQKPWKLSGRMQPNPQTSGITYLL